MYFSGQMLDEYSRHLALLQTDPIADYVSDESDPADKARVSVAGIITSVTHKTTKSGDRMAFFTLEDRAAEIECIAFARQFGEYGHLIHVDSGVFVSGTISLREDEPPKILLNRMDGLIENSDFRPELVSQSKEAVRASERVTEQREAVLSREQESLPPSMPKRLFLRVPSDHSAEYHKALNLVELFDGDFPAFFFFAGEKRYETTPHGVALSDYVLRELRALLGVENVILK